MASPLAPAGDPDARHDAVLDRFRTQSAFSAAGRHSRCLDRLPSDPAGVARVLQGLLIYEHVAGPFYGYALPDQRRAESHIRPAEALIERVLALDERPLDVPRPPERRLVGICRHFMLLAITILRHHGIPARGRGGFGAYCNPGTFEDHWVCEYWRQDEGRWAKLDAQFDDVFVRRLSVRHDVLDVPCGQFLTASDAWLSCRRGERDPQAFGIEFAKLRGLWFIAGSLVRDLAALNGGEVLPWDFWGNQPEPGAELGADDLSFFDELARLTGDPDANFAEISRRFRDDAALRLPQIVFNSLRGTRERVLAG